MLSCQVLCVLPRSPVPTWYIRQLLYPNKFPVSVRHGWRTEFPGYYGPSRLLSTYVFSNTHSLIHLWVQDMMTGARQYLPARLLRAGIVFGGVCLCVYSSVCPHKISKNTHQNRCNSVSIRPMVNARSGWKLVTFDFKLWPWELFSYFFYLPDTYLIQH